jgi:hypothetical protein
MIFICGGLVPKWQAEVFELPKKPVRFGLFYEICTHRNPLPVND